MTIPSPTAQRSFLDPKVLARIDNLELVARTVVEGFINGLHHSPHIGMSIDFAEHRPYTPGDDIRRIDWRLFARTDRFFVKEFESDTNTNFTVVLDVSRSMDYSSHEVTKIQYAKYLAASLVYFSSRQRDRVGLVTFADGIVDYVPPSAKHLNIILHTLDRLVVQNKGELSRPLSLVSETFRRRGMVLLISDLYGDAADVVEAVNQLRINGNEVIVFHLLDPAELKLDLEGAASYEDLETGDRIPVIPDVLRERYRELMDDHLVALESKFGDRQIDYALFDTSAPLDYALFKYLAERERLSRVR